VNKPLLLVVDDDHKILRLLRTTLTPEFQVVQAERGSDALEILERQRPDLVVLDIIMPGMDGLEVLKRIRETSGVPVILLTAKGTDSDKIQGLELGADDYLAKPFNPDELSARARAVLRRSQARDVIPTDGNRVVCGDIVIDLARRTVYVLGKTVVLSRTEWQLLQQLCVNAGRVMLHEDLLTRTWGPEYRDDVQYLRVWISRLRQKLEENPSAPKYIRTVQGIGYILESGPSTLAASLDRQTAG
jgi:DNA-binding response OmpR family regulator